MSNQTPVKALVVAPMKIGSVEIACAVLDDEDFTAVVSERGVSKALGAKRGGSHWVRVKQGGGAEHLPVYLSAPNLVRFITPELEKALKNPVIYRAPNGNEGHGIRADVLPDICRVFLQAREARELHKSQEGIAHVAEILHHGFSKVGVIGMVYEATGFDKIKDRRVLEHYLSKFLSDHLLDWAKTFPDEFYIQLFRLRGWQWKGIHINRPQVVGHYTNDIVYDRLLPGVREELMKREPKDEKGQTKNRYFQWLSEKEGQPALARHLHTVIAFMRAAPTWSAFYRAIQRAFPKPGEQQDLPGIEDI